MGGGHIEVVLLISRLQQALQRQQRCSRRAQRRGHICMHACLHACTVPDCHSAPNIRKGHTPAHIAASPLGSRSQGPSPCSRQGSLGNRGTDHVVP